MLDDDGLLLGRGMANPTDIYLRILNDVASRDGGVILAWLIFGLVLLAPILMCRRILRLRGAADDFVDIQSRQTLYRIVVALLYPGILGSIFFELLPDLVEVSLNTVTLPLIVLEFAVIGHFCYDFIFIFASYSEKAIHYRLREYGIDIIVVLLLYLSATAVDLRARTADVAEIGALFSILYFLFAIWDLVRQEGLKATAIDAGLATAYFLFTESAAFLNTILGGATAYVLAAIIVIGTTILSVTTHQLEGKPLRHKAKRGA